MWSHFPDGEPDEDAIRRMSAPENELPVALPLNRILARTDDLAIAVVGLQVYTTGLSFELLVRVRPSAAERIGPSLQELFWDHPPRGGSRFLLGVEFGDGRRATNVRTEREGVVLTQGGGGGGDTAIDQSWWLSPLPSDGPLRIVVRCDQLGIAETVVELDGTTIRGAGDDVVTVWPWEPPSALRDVPPPPPPSVPPDSWFRSS